MSRVRLEHRKMCINSNHDFYHGFAVVWQGSTEYNGLERLPISPLYPFVEYVCVCECECICVCLMHVLFVLSNEASLEPTQV